MTREAATKPSTNRRRLAREDWIAFARKVLVKSGIDEIKVDRLAQKAHVSRGSFYWHFKNREDLLASLLRDWEVRNHVEIAEIRERWENAQPDLSEVFAIWLGEPSNFLDFDIAIREWARRTPGVAAVVQRVDAAWIALLEYLFLKEGYGPDDALVRARISYFHQVGYHALAFKEDPEDRLHLVPFYYRALTGKEPGERLATALRDIELGRRS